MTIMSKSQGWIQINDLDIDDEDKINRKISVKDLKLRINESQMKTIYTLTEPQ